jgi:hypothetical protein
MLSGPVFSVESRKTRISVRSQAEKESTQVIISINDINLFISIFSSVSNQQG